MVCWRMRGDVSGVELTELKVESEAHISLFGRDSTRQFRGRDDADKNRECNRRNDSHVELSKRKLGGLVVSI